SCHIRTQTSMSYLFLSITPPPPSSLLFPYTTLFRSKLAYFTLTHLIPRANLPSLTFRGDDGETVRYFPDKLPVGLDADSRTHIRSEEHTSELQSPCNLVCRLLLEKKKKNKSQQSNNI